MQFSKVLPRAYLHRPSFQGCGGGLVAKFVIAAVFQKISRWQDLLYCQSFNCFFLLSLCSHKMNKKIFVGSHLVLVNTVINYIKQGYI